MSFFKYILILIVLGIVAFGLKTNISNTSTEKETSDFKTECKESGFLFYQDGEYECREIELSESEKEFLADKDLQDIIDDYLAENNFIENDSYISKSDLKDAGSLDFVWDDIDVSGALTIESFGSVHWSSLHSYPDGCPSGKAVSKIGDTIECISVGSSSSSSLWTDGGSISYLAATSDDLSIGGTTSSSPFFFDTSAETLNISGLSVRNGSVFNESGGNYDFRVEGDTNQNLIFADASTDYVGIGHNAPTAYLDIKGSTTSDAALRIRSGDIPTSKNAGDFYNNNGTLFFIPVADQRSVDLSNGIITADTTVSNTITETTIYTEEISPNMLHTGQVVECKLMGFYSTANASDTYNIRFKVSGTTIETKQSVAQNVTDGPWQVEFRFTVRSIGSSGTIVDYLSAVFNDVHDDKVNTSVNTINTTVADDVTATVQWDTAHPSNTLTITQGWCHFIN